MAHVGKKRLAQVGLGLSGSRPAEPVMVHQQSKVVATAEQMQEALQQVQVLTARIAALENQLQIESDRAQQGKQSLLLFFALFLRFLFALFLPFVVGVFCLMNFHLCFMPSAIPLFQLATVCSFGSQTRSTECDSPVAFSHSSDSVP